MGAVMASAQVVEIAEAFTVAAEGRCGAQTITPVIVSRARKARVREVRSRMCTDVPLRRLWGCAPCFTGAECPSPGTTGQGPGYAVSR
jgi:hypothetical protein